MSRWGTAYGWSWTRLGILIQWKLSQSFLSSSETESAYNSDVPQLVSHIQHWLYEPRTCLVSSWPNLWCKDWHLCSYLSRSTQNGSTNWVEYVFFFAVSFLGFWSSKEFSQQQMNLPAQNRVRSICIHSTQALVIVGRELNRKLPHLTVVHILAHYPLMKNSITLWHLFTSWVPRC